MLKPIIITTDQHSSLVIVLDTNTNEFYETEIDDKWGLYHELYKFIKMIERMKSYEQN